MSSTAVLPGIPAPISQRTTTGGAIWLFECDPEAGFHLHRLSQDADSEGNICKTEFKWFSLKSVFIYYKKDLDLDYDKVARIFVFFFQNIFLRSRVASSLIAFGCQLANLPDFTLQPKSHSVAINDCDEDGHRLRTKQVKTNYRSISRKSDEIDCFPDETISGSPRARIF